MAEASILNDKDILRHLIEILQIKDDKSKLILKQLKLFILKTVTHMINVRGVEFIQIL
jgi:hypothetical protein